MSDGVRVDGRTARAQRTRAAIVEAHLNLLIAGDLRPTGERIAEAAGVSLRTLWTNFKDLETLYAATGELIFATMREGRQDIPADLPLAERIERYCYERVRELEILAPAARAAVLREPFSAQLRANRTIYLDRVSADVTAVFGGEIAAAGSAAGELTHALVINSSFAAWQVLRDQLNLERAEATAVMRRSLRALLGCRGPDSVDDSVDVGRGRNPANVRIIGT